MSESKEWSLIKRTLGWAYIVLEELTMSQPSNSVDPITKNKMEQAKTKIAETLRNPAVEVAAQNVEYQSLVQKLQAADMPITDERIDRAKRL
ncbi:hypothetical protein LEP3755_35780 [Leptolyngbya sp. NIES-3755]|nr:hypothetical protein LEP3755_35780 [Leptolyngbya sp. NIES-3755]